MFLLCIVLFHISSPSTPPDTPGPSHQRPPLARRHQSSEDPKETVEQDLCSADQAESHAETEQTPAVGDVAGLGDLLILLESLCVRILDEDVEHDQVVAGVVKDPLFDRTSGERVKIL